MIIVAALIALNAVTVLAAFGALRWQARASQRDRTTLIGSLERATDQVCHLSGRTWTPPPPRPDTLADANARDPKRDDDQHLIPV